MNVFIDFSKGKIEKVNPAPIYFGNNNVDKITLYFKNIDSDVEWFPALSASRADGNSIYPRLADANGTGIIIIDSVEYQYYEFTLSQSNGWNLVPGKTLFYVWVSYPDTNGNKCIGTFGCTILGTSGYYKVDNIVVNPELREYLENSFNQHINEVNNKFDELKEEFNDEYSKEINLQRGLINNLVGGEPRYVNTSSNILSLTSNKGVAVATDNGHWYYWDGTKYVDGGIYQSSEDIKQLKEDLEKCGFSTISFDYTTGYFITSWSGEITTGWSNGGYSNPIEVKKGDYLYFTARGYQTQVAMICTCDSNGENRVVKVKSKSSNVVELYEYYCEIDGYIVVSFDTQQTHLLQKSRIITEDLYNQKFNPSEYLSNGTNVISTSILSDANNVILNKVYLISTLGVNNLPINKPGMLWTLRGASDYYNVQFFNDISSETGKMYYRYKINNTWGSWNTLNGSNQSETTIPYADNLYYGIPKMGIIGDSLASGASFDGTNTLDHYEYSWGKHMERASGQTYKWFSFGGAHTRSWLTNSYYGLPKAIQEENFCNCYIIGLMVNDSYALGIDYLGTIDDIDTSDYNNNADTYYGNYAKIIQQITSVNPKAKFFLMTNPRSNSDNYAYFNQAVKDIANLFSNCYLVDMFEKYNNEYTSGVILSCKDQTNHYNAMGYACMAKLIGKAISEVIANNMNDFRYIQFE